MGLTTALRRSLWRPHFELLVWKTPSLTPRVVADNKKAMSIVMAMMAEEKIVLLENVCGVSGALLAVSNDRVRELPAVRYKVQREMIGLKFDGKGKMKQYFDQLEDLVRLYRMAGERRSLLI